MPLLILILLSIACLQREWPNPFDLAPLESALATAGVLLVPLALGFANRTRTLLALKQDPSRWEEIARRFARTRLFMLLPNLALIAFALAGLGWGHTVWSNAIMEWRGKTTFVPFGELIVIAPYLVVVSGLWLVYYDVDAALFRASRTEGQSTEFWSRGGWFVQQSRSFMLFILLPLGLMLVHRSAARFLPEIVRTDWYQLLALAGLPAFILFAPLFVKPLLGLRTLPPGPARTRIENLARRLGFRCRDFLFWHTHHSMMNAMIVGLFPRMRYVAFTDAILRDLPPEELDSVFGHEVGHARHGHIWYYALFIMLGITVVGGLFVLAGVNSESWMLVGAGAYLFAGFGFLSRRCERQADVFGCRAGSCSDPDCTGHGVETVFPERGRGLCPTGIRTCARALERVHLMNQTAEAEKTRSRIGRILHRAGEWLRAWQHAPMSVRIGFLMSIIEDRGREARFQRRLRALRWFLVIGLVAGMVLIGQAVGWRRMMENDLGASTHERAVGEHE